ncbi:TetR/AcrR family transcriptional regulator [Rhizobium ruizarguesonis]|uniref:TetR/AcrR family transcriptional regulator n=1 Tax=Rhizobium ruizarguesonis TaxID=2081791 RepID=UPI00041C2946|nr:TetR/AcrR family transcriptional regulator [Rhizobium ruizarguesonis]NKL14787.1 TetR family transcriptional regulator [Rhizobium leguminosarum bv. viciae]QIJ39465.1 TetR/AcrR family transcriptional regulator [Rhizobium leguminosarum]QIO44544.1 TetR/AcrR family transcriptional regulator [Rhizobium leguminosarum bv. trifolii]NEH32107.1 TetR family transcriptional regulator [Rhizobium ruizarguesonis]NEJ01710.1 TetR family transcriptional regulator [Rhizobium ruizarguesonis]
MGIAERKSRERAGREERIVAAARAVAESEGWDAVTIRRLAKEIEYSQPILYSHFANRDAIVAAVAVEGFKELATVLREAAGGANGQRESLMDVAMAYFAFALSRPALYEAMFILPTQLQFAEAETRSELRAGFDAIAAAVSPFCADVEIVTETFWAALHGLAELERSGRIRPGMRDKRIALVVQAIVDAGGNAPGRGG